jgi:hypothetical protein
VQVVLTSGEVDGWVMLQHPDLGELIRQLGSEWMVGEGCLETLWNLLMVRMFG